jgi:hypothetical protein
MCQNVKNHFFQKTQKLFLILKKNSKKVVLFIVFSDRSDFFTSNEPTLSSFGPIEQEISIFEIFEISSQVKKKYLK